ncbi:MAG TPA: S46 family peptidase, partial [Elusimicrobiota bacterium]|nr:S46 family peptidase [Elusimicrobiota bacterium]
PRFWLDTAFLRVYGDDGKPLKTPDFFPFRPGGAQNGEPVFTSGFPFATGRFNTEAQAKLERDLVNPAKLKENAAFRDALRSYAALGERQAGEVERDLDWREYMVHWHGRMQPILDDPAFLEGKRRDDAALRSGIAKLPEARRREFDGLLERADASTARIREGFAERTYRTLGDESKLAVLARDVLRYGRELGKPSERRSEGYDSDEALAKRRKEILEAEAGDPELERRLLQARLELAGRELGGRDPFVRATLDGCAAESAACRAVEGTRLADPAFREKLLDDGARAIRASRDPFLVLARAAQPYVDRAERWEESEAAAADDLARQLLAKARRAVQGAQAYPDANWSPRISYGRVEGWSDGWQDYPHRTTFFGLFDAARAADNKPPNRLDEAFERAVGRLDLGTPFNFLHSTDIASGNSGSAVIDRDRRLVGILFDSNRPAVADIYRYHRDGRTTSVDAAGILEALDKVYGMGWLARELTERAAPAAAAGRPSS